MNNYQSSISFLLVIKLQRWREKNSIKQLDQMTLVTSVPPLIKLNTISIVILVAVVHCMQLECFQLNTLSGHVPRTLTIQSKSRTTRKKRAHTRALIEWSKNSWKILVQLMTMVAVAAVVAMAMTMACVTRLVEHIKIEIL